MITCVGTSSVIAAIDSWDGTSWSNGAPPAIGDDVVINASLAWSPTWASNLNSFDLASGTVTLASSYTLNLNIAGSATIAPGTTIDVSATNLLGYGPWNDQLGSAHGGNGVGYSAYDSIFQPAMPGQATIRGTTDIAGGGGVVSLTVGGVLALNGSIFSDGTVASSNPVTFSSGGSVYLHAGSISGTGTVTANGSSPSGLWGSNPGGAGGRVAVIAGDNSSLASLTLTANGSDNTNADRNNQYWGAAAGTVYTQTAATGAGHGTVYVAQTVNPLDNGHAPWDPPALPTTNYTPMAGTAADGSAEDLSNTKWIVSNYGQTVLNNNTTVSQVTLSGNNAKLNLNGYALTLSGFTDQGGVLYHTRGLYTDNTSNYFNNVDFSTANSEIIIAVMGSWIQTTGGTQSWATSDNWSSNSDVPGGGLGDTASFRSTGAGSTTITLDGSRTLSGLNFAGTDSYTITRAAGDTTSQITLLNNGAAVSVTVSSGNHAITAPLVLSDNLAINAGAGASLSLGQIGETGGSRSFGISGGGLVTLTGANTYSGGTTLNGGTLALGPVGALPSGGNITVQGTLDLVNQDASVGALNGRGTVDHSGADSNTLTVGQGGASCLFSGVIQNSAGSLGLTKTGSGTVTLTTSQNYSGATIISGGVLKLAVAPGVLAHRWDFNNSLADSVGGSTAVLYGNTTLGTNQVTINGNGTSHYSYVDLGPNILPMTNSPVTIELWATQNAVQNWSRIFDFGRDTGNYMLMSWTRGWEINQNQVHFLNGNSDDQMGPYTLGTEFHIAMVLTPNGDGTTISAYKMDSSGNVLGSTSFTSGSNLSQLAQNNMWLGRSEWPDNDANASYNEVRIWDTALTQSQLTSLSVLGPDVSFGVSNLLPVATPVRIAANSTLDLGGGSQQVASISDYSPGLGGSVINSATGTISVLTLSPTNTSTTFSGQIQGTNGGTQGDISLVLNGSGTLVLAGTNTYTGGTDVMAGTLVLASPTALADGSSLTVGADAATIFGTSLGSGQTAVSSAVLPVPEPGTLLLLVAALWSAVACYRFSKRSAMC